MTSGQDAQTSQLPGTRRAGASKNAWHSKFLTGLILSALVAGALLATADRAAAAACTPITAGGGSSASRGMTGALSHAFGGSSEGTASTAYGTAAPSCTVPVPNLARMTPAEAARKLEAGKLEMTVARRVDSKGSVDRIAGQSPAAGSTVECGCTVSVVVAAAVVVDEPLREAEPERETDPLVTVPDVVGRSLDRAIATLKRAPLSIEVAGPSRFEGVPGVVARQFPAAGQKARLGSIVALRLKAAGVTVPSLVGKTPEAARALIKEAGLRWTVADKRPSDRTQDSIVGQTPRAGTVVRPGSRVAVTIALAREMVQVPDVTRSAPREALVILSRKGLAGRIAERTPGEDEVARVIGQTPAPGTWVPLDSTVRLAVAEARPMAEVPEVTGLDPDAAAAAIAGAELVMRVAERSPSELPEDRVARQRPAAGSRVPLGTVVEVGIDLARVLPPLTDVRDVALPEKTPAPPPEAIRPPLSPEKPLPPPVVETPIRQIPVVAQPSWREWIATHLRPEDLRFAALLLLFLLASLVVRQIRKRRKLRKDSAASAVPRFEAHTDSGVQQVEMEPETDSRPEIRLRPVGDAGIQSLEIQQPDLFEEERRYA